MFKRKIEKYLEEWKRDEHKMPLIIKGCRQCGKTFSVLDFAHKNYEHIVYLDFFQHPEYKSAFDGGLDIDLLCMTLSTLIPDADFVPGNTCSDAIHAKRYSCYLSQYHQEYKNCKRCFLVLSNNGC